MLITLAEYAQRKGKDPANLRQKIARGKLEAIKMGRDWLIEEDTPLEDGRVKSGKYRDWRKK